MKEETPSPDNNTFNPANCVSIYRIAASLLLTLALVAGMKTLFAWLLLISLSSDIIDGIVARRMKMVTTRGARLDSIGDALTFSLAAIGVYVFEHTFLLNHLMAVLMAVVPYFLQIVLAVIRYGRPSSFHTYLAKAAALFQGCFILLLLFFEPWLWLFYATVTITVLEVAEEIILLYLVARDSTDVKGLYWIIKMRRNARLQDTEQVHSAVKKSNGENHDDE